MESTQETTDRLREVEHARRRVRWMRSFYIHAAGYGTALFLLFLINLLVGRSWWFVWPAVAWGAIVAVHAWAVFSMSDWLGPGWEERKVRELLKQSDPYSH